MSLKLLDNSDLIPNIAFPLCPKPQVTLKIAMHLPIYFFLILCSTVTGKYTGPTNQAGLNIIKEYEGFHPNVYNNVAGKYAIGYGYGCRQASSCSTPILGKYEVPLAANSAEALLKEDLRSRGGSEECVNNAITYRQLGQNEFSALVSFVHSVGCDAFRISYLRNKVNRGQLKAAEGEFKRHVYSAGGWRHKALVRRRNAEKRLFSRDALLKQRPKTSARNLEPVPAREEGLHEDPAVQKRRRHWERWTPRMMEHSGEKVSKSPVLLTTLKNVQEPSKIKE